MTALSSELTRRVSTTSSTIRRRILRRQTGWQVLALLTACMLSLGSHYGTYLLGPLKTSLNRELGSDNVQFSILIGSFSLNNTWTPLVGGIITARLGTAISSILATGLILSGQLLLLFGRWHGQLATMAWGCFLFGLGTSPLAVVQETIICRFFERKGLGISLALGLVAGKGASFLSSIISLPLSQRYGPTAPFLVASGIALLSFCVNIFYLVANRWLAANAGVAQEDGVDDDETDKDSDADSVSSVRLDTARYGTQLEPTGASESLVPHRLSAVSRASTRHPIAARRITLADLARLGDPFWIYMALNFLCGTIWYPFLHLAANLVQKRFGLTESQAAKDASILLAGPLVLYPLVGSIVDACSATPSSSNKGKPISTAADPEEVEEPLMDSHAPSGPLQDEANRFRDKTIAKRAKVVHQLFILSSLLTMACFAWLALPVNLIKTPVPGLVSWGIGHGFATLLLVLVVPGIVVPKYVPLALGAHKSIEMAGSTLSSTIAGWLLDAKPSAPAPKQPTSSAQPPIQSAKGGPPIPLDSGEVVRLTIGFLLANVLQLALVLWLRAADIRQHKVQERLQASALVLDDADQDSDDPLLSPKRTTAGRPSRDSRRSARSSRPHLKHSQHRRGRIFLAAYISAVVAVWVVFGWTVAEKFARK